MHTKRRNRLFIFSSRRFWFISLSYKIIIHVNRQKYPWKNPKYIFSLSHSEILSDLLVLVITEIRIYAGIANLNRTLNIAMIQMVFAAGEPFRHTAEVRSQENWMHQLSSSWCPKLNCFFSLKRFFGEVSRSAEIPKRVARNRKFLIFWDHY